MTLNPENLNKDPSDFISLLSLTLKTSRGSIKVDTIVLAIITLKKVEAMTPYWSLSLKYWTRF